MPGLYIHVPFCVSKCAYCDFYSLPGQAHLTGKYIRAVHEEAAQYRGQAFNTLYLGGGTPSLLGAQGLRELVGGLGGILNLSSMDEATVEVNPESTTEALLESALEAGVTRISVGVQSLSDGELRSVGRAHTAGDAIRAVERAVRAGFRSVSADLIIGLPGQRWQSLEDSVKRLAGLGVSHFSIYCLSLESGTPLERDRPSDLPSDNIQAALYEQARDLLGGLGFNHYEISNFARSGMESRHNLNYWRGGEYIGLGPAAASHLWGRRFRNRADLAAYLLRPAGVVEEIEELGPAAKAAEESMLRLRLLQEGVDINIMSRRYGADIAEMLRQRLDGLAAEGSLIKEGPIFRLAPSRVLTSNPVFAEVLG